MKCKRLFTEEDAVSPVIAVILMVAITVILAAVIGTFVLGLGQNVQQTAPQASFDVDVSDDKKNLTITHAGGDAVQAHELLTKVTLPYYNGTEEWPNPKECANWSYITGSTADVTAGTSATINATSGNTFAGETVRMVWRNPSTDRTQTLRTYEVPS